MRMRIIAAEFKSEAVRNFSLLSGEGMANS